MLRNRSALLAVVLLAGLSLHVQAAGPQDLATHVPAETALFAGWSWHVDPDGPEQQFAQRMLTQLRTFVAQEAPPAEAEILNYFLDVQTALQRSNGVIALYDVVLTEDDADVQLAAVLQLDADARDLANRLEAVIGKVLGPQAVTTHTISGTRFRAFPLPDMPAKLYWATHDDLLIFTLGQAAAEKTLATIAGDHASLASHSEYQFACEKIDATMDTNHFTLYLAAKRILDRTLELVTEMNGPLPPIVDPALEELGIRSVKSKILHCESVDGQPARMAAYAHIVGEPKGLVKLYAQPPLSEDDLRIVPRDAYWAEITNIDLHAIWNEVLRITDALAPDARPMIEGSVAMVGPMLGVSIVDELLPAIGDTWAAYDAPSHGGLLLTGTVLAIDVNDEQVVNTLMTRIIAMATPFLQQEDVYLVQKTTQYDERTIHYVFVGGVPSPVAPAWTFVEGRWVCGLFPQTVAAAAQQIDPASRGPSLLDHPAVKAARSKLPDDPWYVFYADVKYLMRLLYPILNGASVAGMSMWAPQGAELSLALMPPVADVVGEVDEFVAAIGNEPGGIKMVGVGDGSQLTVAAIGATALGGSIMIPSFVQARETAKRVASMANLRNIGVGVMLYSNDNHDRFPPSLDVLVDEGFLMRKLLQSPQHPDNVDVSYVYIAGQSPNDHPRNVLAYEKPLGADRLNVLFNDGSVQWMSIEQFRSVLRQTYERLNREEEIPAEFR